MGPCASKTRASPIVASEEDKVLAQVGHGPHITWCQVSAALTLNQPFGEAGKG